MYGMEKLKPVALDDLVRLGSRHDGGYVLPRHCCNGYPAQLRNQRQLEL
jgi:hypothetical protein